MVIKSTLIKRRTFSFRITVWIALSSSAIILVTAGLFYSAARKTFGEQTMELNSNLLLQVEQSLVLQDEAIKMLGQAVFINPETAVLLFNKPEPDGLYDVFQSLGRIRDTVVTINPLVKSIEFFNLPQGIFYTTQGRAMVFDPGLLPLLDWLALQGIPAPGHTRMLGGELVVSYLLADSWDLTGRADRGIILNLDANRITSDIREQNRQSSRPGDKLLVLDRNGAVIAGDQTLAASIWKAMTNLAVSTRSEQHFQIQRIQGRKYLISRLDLGSVDWILVKLSSAEEVYRSLIELSWWIVGVTFLMLIVTVFVSLGVAYHVYRPLADLIRTVRGKIVTGAEGDEFAFLREVYRRAQDESAQSPQPEKDERKILAGYFLRRLVEFGSPISSQELAGAKETGISLDLDRPLTVIALWREEEPPHGAMKLLLEQCQACFDSETFEIIPLEEHLMVILVNDDADGETGSGLRLVLSEMHAALAANGMMLSMVQGEGPCGVELVPQRVSETIASLKSCRAFRKGGFIQAADLRNSRNHGILVQTMKDIMALHFADPGLGPERLAETLKMSSSYLNRIFKDWEGCSVFEYLTFIRLEQAALRLARPANNSIKEVMAAVGIENESSFYKAFKRRYGLTPREFSLKAAMSGLGNDVSPQVEN